MADRSRESFGVEHVAVRECGSQSARANAMIATRRERGEHCDADWVRSDRARLNRSGGPMREVEVLGRIGPDGPALLVLYTLSEPLDPVDAPDPRKAAQSVSF